MILGLRLSFAVHNRKRDGSRKGAKHVLSEVEGGAKVRKNYLYSFAYLASWRDKESEPRLQIPAQIARCVTRTGGLRRRKK
jgi:hypothetical protein